MRLIGTTAVVTGGASGMMALHFLHLQTEFLALFCMAVWVYLTKACCIH